MIGHTFQSGDILTVAKRSYGLLKSTLASTAVMNLVLYSVFNFVRAMTCTLAGICSWMWLDDAKDTGIFKDGVPEEAPVALLIFMCYVMYRCVRSPVVSIVLVILLSDWTLLKKADKDGWLHGIWAGIFLGSVCCLFFQFVQYMVLYTAESLIFAHAVANKQQKVRRVWGSYSWYQSSAGAGEYDVREQSRK